MDKLGKYSHLIEKFIGEKMIDSVRFKADILMLKPKPEDKYVRRKLTGKAYIIIELTEPYEED